MSELKLSDAGAFPAPNPANQPMDDLMDAQRIRGESRMIAEGTAPEAVTEDLARQVLANVEKYRGETRRTYASIARDIGYSSPTLSAVFKGNYAGDWRTIIIDLDRWLDDQEKHDAAPRTGTFIWTTVAKEILAISDAAIALRSIGLVYGPDTSGLGKTMALEAIAREKAGAILVTVTKARRSAANLIMDICQALNIKTAYEASTNFTKIVQSLKGTPRLLMIDQIHSLCDTPDDKAFYTLADIFDATRSPQLWCGTRDIVAYLSRRIGKGGGKETLAQIRRRISPVRDLMERTRRGDGGKGDPLYTIEEIRQVFGKNKIRLASDAARFLLHLANTPDSGALGMATQLVRMATLIEDAKRTTLLTADHLRSAAKFLLTRDGFAEVEARIEEESSRPLAKLA